MTENYGEIAWDQIPVNTKMCIGAINPRFNLNDSQDWHLKFDCNLSDDGMFISAADEYPHHFITVYLNGNDTYDIRRWRVYDNKKEVCESEYLNCYCMEFDNNLMAISDNLPMGPGNYNLRLNWLTTIKTAEDAKNRNCLDEWTNLINGKSPVLENKTQSLRRNADYWLEERYEDAQNGGYDIY